MHIPKQDYSPAPVIPGVEIINLKVHKDDGGSFRELVQLLPTRKLGISVYVGDRHVGTWKGVQVNDSVMHPGAIKGIHIHPEQFDLWYVKDKLVVVLVDCRGYQEWAEELAPGRAGCVPGIQEYAERHGYKNYQRLVLEDQLLLIPPMVGHGASNPYDTDRRITYFVSEFFGTGEQEGRIPWNVLGEDIWTIQKG